MLGKMFSFLPVSGVPYKLNLMSAIFGAASAYLIFKAVNLLTGSVSASLFAGLLSAFAPLAWVESVKAEVYTLNGALVMLVVYLGLRFLTADRDIRLLYLAVFAIGLGMGNHHTIGFMALPLAPLFFLKTGEGRVQPALMAFLLFAVGVVGAYSFLHFRSARYLEDGLLFSYSPGFTLGDIVDTFLRRQYRGSSLETVASPVKESASWLFGGYNAFKHLVWPSFGAFLILALFSAGYFIKERKALLITIGSFLSFGVILPAMVIPQQSPSVDAIFFISPYLLPLLYMTAVVIGIGSAYVLNLFAGRWRFILRPATAGLVLLPFVFTLPGTLKDNDLSDFRLGEDFSINLLSALPPVSVVVTGADASYFPLFYHTLIERRRDDVVILLGDKQGIISQVSPAWKHKEMFPGLSKGMLFHEADEKFVSAGRLFAYDVFNLSEKIRANFTAVPYIHAFRLYPKDSKKISGEAFAKAAEMFVYERVLAEKADDMFSVDLKMSFFTTLTHYGYVLRGENPSLSDRLYKDSLRLITAHGLAYYLHYLRLTENRSEIEAFLDSIEPEAKKYPEVRLLKDALKRHFL